MPRVKFLLLCYFFFWFSISEDIDTNNKLLLRMVIIGTAAFSDFFIELQLKYSMLSAILAIDLKNWFWYFQPNFSDDSSYYKKNPYWILIKLKPVVVPVNILHHSFEYVLLYCCFYTSCCSTFRYRMYMLRMHSDKRMSPR